MNFGHGGNIEEIRRKYKLENKLLIDFSANINPLGISKKVKEDMIKALDNIERYPDITYYDLKEAISEYEGISSENLVLGNGAAEVIFNIVRGLKPKKVLLPAPTFSEYGEAIESIDGEIKYCILNNKFKLEEEFIMAIDKDIDMIFLCNPNNPTGVLTNREYIIKVLNKALTIDTIVVIDESFIDFIENKNDYSMINFCNEYKNLIVVKSLTKFFAFPGIRIGYGISGNKEIINKISKVSISWSINTVAAMGAASALKQKQYISDSINYVNKQREFLYNELSKIKKIHVFKPSVNFILFRTSDNDLREKLLKEGIIIRSCHNYIGLENGYYRVAVRTEEENIKLIEALRKVL